MIRQSHLPGLLILLFALVTVSGCASFDQLYSSTRHENLGLQAGDLERAGSHRKHKSRNNEHRTTDAARR